MEDTSINPQTYRNMIFDKKKIKSQKQFGNKIAS